MTNEQTSVLVLKDQAGDYFLIPAETLARGRVPEEQKAEVERLIATGDAGGDSVQGYASDIEKAHIVYRFFLTGGVAGALGSLAAIVTDTGTLNGPVHR